MAKTILFLGTIILLPFLVCWQLLLHAIAFLLVITHRTPIKVENNELKTAIWYLWNQFGKEIVLIGLARIGEKSYYQEIASTIETLEKNWSIVCCEGYAVIPSLKKGKWTKYERSAIRWMTDMKNLVSLKAEILGLHQEAVRLPIRENWQIIDLSIAEVIGRIAARKALYRGSVETSTFDHDKLKERMIGESRNSLIDSVEEGLLNFFFRKDRWLEEAVIAFRDRNAFEGIVRKLDDHDSIVLVYGTIHLPGIRRMLEATGFRLENEDWQTSYHFPFNNPLFQISDRELITAISSQFNAMGRPG